jgi:hypothetical protein
MMTDIRYPIGRFEKPETITHEQIQEWIRELKEAPDVLAKTVRGLTGEQLDTPYREGGWTPRQIVHHLYDTHINNYIRFKLGYMEENPTVTLFDLDKWADCPDARTAPVELSLEGLRLLHLRWAMFLESLSFEDFSRTFRHPKWGDTRLDEALGIFVWHIRHHTAQIAAFRERMGG